VPVWVQRAISIEVEHVRGRLMLLDETAPRSNHKYEQLVLASRLSLSSFSVLVPS
jgi:hypothetical protein